VAFQGIKLFDVVVRQFNEWDGFRHFHHGRTGKRTEALEAVMPRRRVGARIGSAQTTAVRKRMLDAAHAPALVIKHEVVNDASNGQLGVLLDWIVFKVLVTAVSINYVAPRRVAFTNPTK